MNLRPGTLALLALLTLLQGIAPLLHAHVGGQFVRTGAHVHLASKDARPLVGAPVAQPPSADFFQASETAEIGLGLVIERRLLLLATSGEPVLPASAWPLPDLQLAVRLPLTLPDEAPAPRRTSALPPPSTAPPTRHA